MFTRSNQLPQAGTETFRLWGPRQTGKTTFLRATYPDAFWVDLLKAEGRRRYLQNPERLREERGRPVSISSEPATVRPRRRVSGSDPRGGGSPFPPAFLPPGSGKPS